MESMAFVTVMALCAFWGAVSPCRAAPLANRLGYQLTLPAGWLADTSDPDAWTIHTRSVRSFSPVVFVTTRRVPAGVTVQTIGGRLTRASRKESGYRTSSERYVTVHGARALDRVATFTTGVPPRAMQSHRLIVVRNGREYDFLCLALKTEYGRYARDFSALLASVHLSLTEP